MSSTDNIGRILIAAGLFLIFSGVVLILLSRFGVSGFKMPGDIVIHRERYTVYFPVVTFLLISLVATIILNLVFRR